MNNIIVFSIPHTILQGVSTLAIFSKYLIVFYVCMPMSIKAFISKTLLIHSVPVVQVCCK